MMSLRPLLVIGVLSVALNLLGCTKGFDTGQPVSQEETGEGASAPDNNSDPNPNKPPVDDPPPGGTPPADNPPPAEGEPPPSEMPDPPGDEPNPPPPTSEKFGLYVEKHYFDPEASESDFAALDDNALIHIGQAYGDSDQSLSLRFAFKNLAGQSSIKITQVQITASFTQVGLALNQTISAGASQEFRIGLPKSSVGVREGVLTVKFQDNGTQTAQTLRIRLKGAIR